MNRELLALYQADRREHGQGLTHGTPAYDAMRARDRQRRQRVAEIMAEGDVTAPEDVYHAAWIFNHGDTPEDAWQGHTFAKQAADLGFRPARWLAAATYDRWRMYQGQPQRYGTQFAIDATRHRLWDVDPDTTDAERAEWDVPPLAEQLRRAEELTQTHPPGPIGEDAPQWLKDALVRWAADETPDDAT
ncbi:MAG: hypothetical protein AAF845_04195 [Bacteroidota bacterium]